MFTAATDAAATKIQNHILAANAPPTSSEVHHARGLKFVIVFRELGRDGVGI